MAKRTEQPAVVTTIANAISAAFSDIESLRDELQEWYDNMPEGPQGGDKGQQVQDCIDQLEQSQEPDESDYCTEWKELAVQYSPFHSTAKKAMRASRATRCAEAAYVLGHAIEVLDTWIAEQRRGQREGVDDVIEAADEMLDLLNTAKDEWEGAEFPGMYG